ncbi:hypothetical protein AX14_012616 [Amanita brunnescens Koide BX004]|nr:hypothetical protein AX14_012616 [Amanita brunnescens Koide BX004]
MDPMQAILNAYAEIERHIDVCLCIQNGDSGRLQAQLRKVVALKADARNRLEREQYEVIHDSLEEMIAYLNGAITIASDDAGGHPVPVAYQEHSGTGRPRIHIDPIWLSHAHPGSSLKKIATLLGCSARTVRRRLIDYELAVPVPPVIQEVPQPDGTIAKEWHPTGPMGFDLKDEPDRRPIGIQEDDVGNVDEFGIDWEDLEDEELIQALQERAKNPFDDYVLDTMNNVPCHAPDCPLSMDQVQGLKRALYAEFDMDTHHMDVWREIWI